MECKDDNYYLAGPAGEYWNISRMECKEKIGERLFILQRIGIYPEWNVKYRTYGKYKANKPIGIYPEWNVKLISTKMIAKLLALEYIQNGM